MPREARLKLNIQRPALRFQIESARHCRLTDVIHAPFRQVASCSRGQAPVRTSVAGSTPWKPSFFQSRSTREVQLATKSSLAVTVCLAARRLQDHVLRTARKPAQTSGRGGSPWQMSPLSPPGKQCSRSPAPECCLTSWKASAHFSRAQDHDLLLQLGLFWFWAIHDLGCATRFPMDASEV